VNTDFTETYATSKGGAVFARISGTNTIKFDGGYYKECEVSTSNGYGGGIYLRFESPSDDYCESTGYTETRFKLYYFNATGKLNILIKDENFKVDISTVDGPSLNEYYGKDECNSDLLF
jgi:hypothetical protein